MSKLFAISQDSISNKFFAESIQYLKFYYFFISGKYAYTIYVYVKIFYQSNLKKCLN